MRRAEDPAEVGYHEYAVSRVGDSLQHGSTAWVLDEEDQDWVVVLLAWYFGMSKGRKEQRV